MVRSCTWNGKNPSAWDADLLESSSEIPTDIKKQILGSKRKILFIEGDADSLDRLIYQILYPDVSVLPRGNCVGVERAVEGIKSTEELHWIDALGLIDADDRTEPQIESLKQRGILALPCYSVESLYYHQEIIEKIARKVCETTGEDADQMVDTAASATLSNILDHKERMCARLCEKRIRAEVLAQLPNHSDIQNGRPLSFEVDSRAELGAEKARFEDLHNRKDVNGLIDRYPVRKTPVLNKIASALGFQDRSKYEGAVRTLLVRDNDSRSLLRNYLLDLTEKIEQLCQ